jgi:hypothetical protein
VNRSTARRVAVITPAVLVVAVLVAVGFSTRRTEAVVAPVPVEVGTATVTKTNLSDSQTLPGKIGFGSRTAVLSRAEGVITTLPKVGSTPARGRMLYRVNDQPITVFYGKTPLFRTLRLPAAAESAVRTPPPDPTVTSPPPSPPSKPSRPPSKPSRPPLMHGRDVTVVADNLEKLGYDIGYRPARVEDGDIYTRSLAAAVRRWQKKIGMAATGTIGPSQVIVLPAPVRVESVDARLGDDAEGELMHVSSTRKVITVPVEAGALNGISAGDRVQVEMPDSTSFRASVTSVSRTIKSDQDDDSGGQNAPTLTVTIRPRRASDVADLDSAPVQVRFSIGLRPGVLAAPISALVAVRGGGYALQRPDGSLVAVRTGLFADGLVEVKGAGVTAGMSVQTAS